MDKKDKKEFAALLPKRELDTHKGDYGKVLVIAGSRGMSGAAYLTSQAALLSGAGMVFLAIPKELNSIMEVKLTEAITYPLAQTKEGTLSELAFDEIVKLTEKVDCIAVGPGISQCKSTRNLVVRLLKICLQKKIVIDADGLNVLVGSLSVLKKIKEVVLTPHLGEMSRLVSSDLNRIKKNREVLTKKFSKLYNVTIVLKGFHTLVVDNKKVYKNFTGNPGMATAGCGDVLTGMIAGFLAQGLSCFDSAKLAVFLHGLAGDLAAEEKSVYSLIASDVLKNIAAAIKYILSD
jgi:NAD(P)H-hydrate epimerase